MAHLLGTLEEHEKELAVVRRAAEERLRDVEWLHAQRKQLESSLTWRYGIRPIRAITSLFRK